MKKEYKFLLQGLTVASIFASIPVVLFLIGIFGGEYLSYFFYLSRISNRGFSIFLFAGLVPALLAMGVLCLAHFKKKFHWIHFIFNIIFSIGLTPLFLLGLYVSYITSNDLPVIWMYLFPYVIAIVMFFILTSVIYKSEVKVKLKQQLVVLGLVSLAFFIVTLPFFGKNVIGFWEEKQFVRECNSLVGEKVTEEGLKDLKGTVVVYSHKVDENGSHISTDVAQLPLEEQNLKSRFNSESLTIYEGDSPSSRFGNGWMCQITGKYGEKITNTRASFWLD